MAHTISLHNSQRLPSVNVGRKMFWAPKRETTRVEDITYCLMGIFNVNMPLLHGEGQRAFTRLLEEILKDSDVPYICLAN